MYSVLLIIRPAVSHALTVTRCDPLCRETFLSKWLLFVIENFLAPSTYRIMPVTLWSSVAPAAMRTGDFAVAPSGGAQIVIDGIVLLNVQGGISNFAKKPAPALLWLNVWYASGVVGKFVLPVSPAIYALPA